MFNVHKKLEKELGWYKRWHSNAGIVQIHWLIVMLTAASICLALFAVITGSTIKIGYNSSLAKSTKPAGKVNRYAELSASTSDLMASAKKYREAKESDKPGALADLTQKAGARKRLIVDAAKNDPVSVLAVSFDQKAKDSMPEEITGLLEEQVSLEGDLAVGHGDDFPNKSDSWDYTLNSSGSNYSIYPTARQDLSFNTGKVKVKGFKVDNTVVLNEKVQILSTVAAATTAPVVKRIAVILLNFQDYAAQPMTQDEARGRFFTNPDSTEGYYKDSTWDHVQIQGKIRADGDVFGWYTVPFSYGSCPSGSPPAAWGDAAASAAAHDGYLASNYTITVFFFPGSNCSWGGYAWSSGGVQRNYINGMNNFTYPVLSHEVGHLLGPNHANTYNCGSVAIAPAANCASAEYGDPFTVMGNGGNQFTGYHKNMVGAFASSNMQNVTSSGTYTIAPLEQNTSAVQTLKIDRAKSGSTVYDSYYLDYRQPIGFDSNLGAPTTTGVMVHIADCSSPYVNCPLNSYASCQCNKTLLIDAATPGDGNFANSALQPGQTFDDPEWGISVTVVSADTSGATVQITKSGPPCVRANPTVSVSPVTQWVNPNGSATYNVTVTNNDNSGCSNAAIAVVPSLSSGLIQSPAQLSFNIAPGSSASGTVTVSNSNVAGTLSQFTEVATNSASNQSAQATANSNVLTPDTTSPQLTITSPGATIPSKGNANFTATASDPSGIAKIVLYMDSASVKTCTNATTCTYSIKKISGGQHTFKAVATDKAGNSTETTKTATR